MHLFLDDNIKKLVEEIATASTVSEKETEVSPVHKAIINNIDPITNCLFNANSYEDRCKLFYEICIILERSEYYPLIRELIIKKVKESNFRTTEPELIEYPAEFNEERKETPRFKPGLCLPKAVSEYLKAAAEYIQVVPEMLALPCLTALTSCVQGKAKVSTAKGQYTQELQIYTMTIAAPGERKSAALDIFRRHIDEMNAINHRRQQRKMIEFEASVETLKCKIAAFKQNRQNAGTEKDFKENLIKLKELEKQKPHLPQTPLTDATPEALTKELEEYNGTATIISGECGILDIMNGMYSKNGTSNIDVLLHGDSGEPLKRKRATGEEVYIERPLITIGTMGQPGKFETLISNKNMNDRGLTARFLYAFPDEYGTRKMNGAIIPEDIKQGYNTIIEKLLSIKLPEELNQTPVLTLDSEAFKIAAAYFDKLEQEKTSGIFAKSEFAKEYGSKQFGRFLKIAAVFHLCEHKTDEKITGDTALKAQRFHEWTSQQANLIFKETATESEEVLRQKELIKKIADKLKKEKTAYISLANLKAAYRRGAYQKNPKLLDYDLEDLICKRYLLENQTNSGEKKTNTNRFFKINPFVYEMEFIK